MDFVNKTSMAAGWTVTFDPQGRELLVVVVKGTFVLPGRGPAPATHRPEAARLADEQVPLTEEDQFTGDPGQSAPRYETDFVLHKPRCDVLLDGTAYAPPGKGVRHLAVRLELGSMNKSFAVVGNRHWHDGFIGLEPSGPEPFVSMPIGYDNAFGGVDRSEEPQGKVHTFEQNPVGQGYFRSRRAAYGKLLPNTEELDKHVTRPWGRYRPMAFGPVGRAWQQRLCYAGTYDQRWQDERLPLLPKDFDLRYFQSAPADQQVPYPHGGERVALHNLTPDGYLSFELPQVAVPVLFLPYKGTDQQRLAVVDTVVLEPDLGRFTMTWRAGLALRQSCFEIRQTLVGQPPRSWTSKRRAEAQNKTYYGSLGALVQNRRAQGDAQ